MRSRTRLVTALAGVLVSGLVGGFVAVVAATPAAADTHLTPGNFTGFGFDKCETPTQSAMNTWLTSSKYWAVGVYISGDMRACKTQANLTSAWVATQAHNGWKVLPLTVGPQASCSMSPGAGSRKRISPDNTNSFAKARQQGRFEAKRAVRAAKALGIAKHSALWYDLEAFDVTKNRCRNSALSFLSGWTYYLHKVHWESGVYSSGASGIMALDDARLNQPHKYHLPDYLWFAVWNGAATIQTSYIESDGWMPHGRMHQYLGGHQEWHGGIPLDDRQQLPRPRPRVGPEPHAEALRRNHHRLPLLSGDQPGRPRPAGQGCQVPAQAAGLLHAASSTVRTASRWPRRSSDFRVAAGFHKGRSLQPQHWAALLSVGNAKLAKYGSYGEMVRRLQRALNAVLDNQLAIDGTFGKATQAAVKDYQAALGMKTTGVATQNLWDVLSAGQLPPAPTPSPTSSPSPTTLASPTPVS